MQNWSHLSPAYFCMQSRYGSLCGSSDAVICHFQRKSHQRCVLQSQRKFQICDGVLSCWPCQELFQFGSSCQPLRTDSGAESSSGVDFLLVHQHSQSETKGAINHELPKKQNIILILVHHPNPMHNISKNKETKLTTIISEGSSTKHSFWRRADPPALFPKLKIMQYKSKCKTQLCNATSMLSYLLLFVFYWWPFGPKSVFRQLTFISFWTKI